LKDVDFSAESGKVMRLDLGANQKNIYSGNSTKEFKEAKAFKFLGVE